MVKMIKKQTSDKTGNVYVKSEKDPAPELNLENLDLSSGEDRNGKPGLELAEEKPKKRKRRTKKKVEEIDPFTFLTQDATKIIASAIPFMVIANYTKDKKWLLSDSQTEILSVQWDRVFNKWLPIWFAKFEAEISLGMAICMILLAQSSKPAEPIIIEGTEKPE